MEQFIVLFYEKIKLLRKMDDRQNHIGEKYISSVVHFVVCFHLSCNVF